MLKYDNGQVAIHTRFNIGNNNSSMGDYINGWVVSFKLPLSLVMGAANSVVKMLVKDMTLLLKCFGINWRSVIIVLNFLRIKHFSFLSYD